MLDAEIYILGGILGGLVLIPKSYWDIASLEAASLGADGVFKWDEQRLIPHGIPHGFTWDVTWGFTWGFTWGITWGVIAPNQSRWEDEVTDVTRPVREFDGYSDA